MKKIKDERLRGQTLKSIRLAFLVQTTGIIIVMGYQAITDSINAMLSNPVWIVLQISMIVLLVANMGFHMMFTIKHRVKRLLLVISNLV
ncbi:hypothetical protein SAMN04488134_10454 [Amphibacillus marinus]|uniref:Uncharacterized protein n=1 Tax=Amphibacillus marinus TaxID=872970 RepID=A0A1H8M6Y1_9BACI|nr:hypothetical protein [Amphibacillus marinus]SEO13147.1 hypothetical protein SAMN04488134_10454 [Amphibacillus marinus]